MEFTENEKEFLALMFKQYNLLLDVDCDGLFLTNGYFNNNDLFELAEKLGIKYW